MKDKFRRLRLAAYIALVAALVGTSLWLGTPPGAQPTVSLPFATVTAVTNANSVQIVGVNPSRRSIQICFPGVAGSVTFAPAPVTPVSLTTGIAVTLTATPATPICFNPPTNIASAGAAWNAIASAAGPFNVTVLEW